MKVGIVPTKYGYSAVALPPYTGRWDLETPVLLTEGQLVKLRGQILHKLAIYCHSLTPWTGLLFTAFLWMVFGGIALYMRLSNYMNIGGIKMIALYGWIMFLFFGDGLWAFGRTVHQIRNLWHARKIRNTLAKGEWYANPVTWGGRIDASEVSERDYIEHTKFGVPATEPYYKEMMRTEPPLAFSWIPLGLLGIVRFLLLGPRIPRPAVVVEMGRLEDELD